MAWHERVTRADVFRTGIEVIDVLTPLERGGKAGLFGGAGVGKTVSRVGGRTQHKAYRDIAGDLRLSHLQFESLEAFSRFGSRLDDQARRTIEHRRRVRAILRQLPYEPLPVVEGDQGSGTAVARGTRGTEEASKPNA